MDKKFKQSLLLVAFGVAMYAALMNLGTVTGFLKSLLTMGLPLAIGFVLAFMLNVPMRGIEKRLTKWTAGMKKVPSKGLLRIVSLLLTLICVALVIVLVCTLVIPEIVESAVSLYELVLEKWPEWQAMLMSYDFVWINEALANIDIGKMVSELTSGAGGIISSAVDFFSSAVSLIATIGIGLVLMIYSLISKDELCSGSKKLLRAHVGGSLAEYIIHVGNLINTTYSKFLSGQCVEACILGVLITIAFSIAGIPYASLTGVVTAVCAFIPYVGAFAACALGAFLVLLAEPGKVILCIAVYMAVQFVENQFIYPHVVGSSVGLSALWTLIAVILGGKLMGLVGMIFFIPLVAVIVSLLKEYTNSVLEKKYGLPPEEEQAAEAE